MMRIFSLVLSAVMLTAIFSSCGGKSEEPVSSQKPILRKKISSEMTSSVIPTPKISDRWWKREETEEKLYCDITLEYNFVDNVVDITLNKEKTWEKDVYTQEDFPGVEIALIEYNNSLQKKLIADELAALDKLGLFYETWEEANSDIKKRQDAGDLASISLNNMYQFDRFRTGLTLILKNPGKQNVINAIKELEKLPYVLGASPNVKLELY